MIGVFDSGYGGLTILDSIRHELPEYDFLYLGDNARAPYGTRSFEVIYQYTLQAVQYLFRRGCRLVILACNTASAKALRTIQQHDICPETHRVLGVIRPTVEAVPAVTRNGHIGILATPGTVSSGSYVLELEKVFADVHNSQGFNLLHISQQACTLWVPLIESGEYLSEGSDWFVEKYLRELLNQDPEIDTILLACTHYPLLLPKIRQSLTRIRQENGLGRLPELVAQGDIVARSLRDYLSRHSEIETSCSKGGSCRFLTTESADKFAASAAVFLRSPLFRESPLAAEHIEL